jgi:ketosteroid isomerase-like protein
MSDPAAVARAYFDAIAAHDAGAIRSLFEPDAELVTMAGTVRGADAIAAFYEQNAFNFDDLQPEPGPFVVEGDRVAVEIRLRMNGTVSNVADVFTIVGEGIRRLAVYMGPPAT